jgi:hypothetical protein
MTYAVIAVERAMKLQEVILRAMSGELTWLQAANILGMHPRSLRRWRARQQRVGYDGLLDRRRQRPSPRLASSFLKMRPARMSCAFQVMQLLTAHGPMGSDPP